MTRSVKNITSIILLIFYSILMITSCSNTQYLDKSLKTSSFAISENKIKSKIDLPSSDLTGVYDGIDDLYVDSDYVLFGKVKNIEYFQVEYDLLRKINILVTKSYKGAIIENTLVSVLENDGYLRLKSLYKTLKKSYEEKHGDKAKEAAWLYSATYMSDTKDINNDMLIKYTYLQKEDSKIGDELLLFLTNSSDDTYKDKKVKFDLGNKLSYPQNAFACLGLFMGKFTLSGDTYKRYKSYYTTERNNGKIELHKMQTIKDSYTAKEMEDELNKHKQ